ncbi:hypothetical protein [Lysobacter enzymogenes]|uniref:hypothetical protein n=1 Tax=Lysobacter enzymogenes TaxID=69 RepID=UPI001A96CF76|nr:hypothetical protein [Lysobacter enzymogenes]QQP97440.1 hypothetical protein JHW38_05240 [Lysobacter enzymogenes]
MKISTVGYALTALAGIVLSLALEFDVPEGAPIHRFAVVENCYAPTGRYANSTNVKCNVTLDGGSRQTLWSRRSFEPGQRIHVEGRITRYSGREYLQIPDDP